MKATRAILLAGLLVVCLVGTVYALNYAAAGNETTSYYVLRAEADEDVADVNLIDEGDFANRSSDEVSLGGLPDDGTAVGVELIVCAGSAASKTFGMKVYGRAETNGPIIHLMTLAGETGTQGVVVYPQGGTATAKYWADTWTVTADGTFGGIRIAGNGLNSVARIGFQVHGLRSLKVVITDADGTTGTEAGDVTVYARRLN